MISHVDRPPERLSSYLGTFVVSQDALISTPHCAIIGLIKRNTMVPLMDLTFPLLHFEIFLLPFPIYIFANHVLRFGPNPRSIPRP